MRNTSILREIRVMQASKVLPSHRSVEASRSSAYKNSDEIIISSKHISRCQGEIVRTHERMTVTHLRKRRWNY